MAARAYILIETQVGRSRDTVSQLRLLDGVNSADIVTGVFDIIALVEAEDMVAMAEIVTGRVQAIHGVQRTITCVATGQ
jgi:DNA-binding Lrp family transcriptional regulator